MEEFKIPKLEKKVAIVVDNIDKDIEEHQYYLYLSTCSHITRGEETIEELLNRGKIFLPVKHVETGENTIINLFRIIYMAEEINQIPETKERVNLILRNGLILEVNHFVNLPESRARILDYLNTKGDFLVFLRNSKKIHINRNSITMVEIK